MRGPFFLMTTPFNPFIVAGGAVDLDFPVDMSGEI
jgi:hypothetical protein